MTRNAPITDEMWERMDSLERHRQRRYAELEPERVMQAERLTKAAAWSHKNEGTPETHEHAARTRQGPLARLFMSGGLTVDQLGYAVEIASVAEAIERDVDLGIVSYEPRIDCSASAKNSLVEGIVRVRREVAYTKWREWLVQPKRAVLDMIVGDPIPFSTAARRYGMGKKRARQLLLDALDRWPAAMDIAEREVDDASLAAAQAGLL